MITTPDTTKLVDTGPSILKANVEKAIKQCKNGGAPDPDQIPADWLTFLDDKNISELTYKNNIYETGII